MPQLADMHMHIGFADEPAEFAQGLKDLGICAFANTVTMQEYAKLSPLLEGSPNIYLGLGMHPWWIGRADEEALDAALSEFDAMLESTRYVGEVGLDFYPTRNHAEREQRYCFEHIIESCTKLGRHLISIHAVRSEDDVLDILEHTGCLKVNDCILHSYGGPSDALTRAIKDGLYFSIGPRTLSSKRGKEYVRAIPLNQLLVETDLPAMPQNDCSPDEIERTLNAVIDEIAALRNEDRDRIAEAISQTSARLLRS